MSLRRYLLLFALGLGAALLTARFQRAPGYMDADYYMVTGQQLARGEGFTEWVLWNYLDDPDGLPHPSHTYWMPLASILAAIGLRLTPFGGFAAARAAFLLLAGLAAPLTASLAFSLYPDQAPGPRRRAATLAGLLAAFSGFYLPFVTTTDAFGLYMVLGALFLRIANDAGTAASVRDQSVGRASPRPSRLKRSLLLGLLAGLMHLARADGLLWLVLGVVGSGELGSREQGVGSREQGVRSREQGVGIPQVPDPHPSTSGSLRSPAAQDAISNTQYPVSNPHPSTSGSLRSPAAQDAISNPSTSLRASPHPFAIRSGCLLNAAIYPLTTLLAYLLITLPWFARNLAVFGAPLAPGGWRALWLISYDELFAYPAGQLTFARWWASGLGEILRGRLWALGQNLQTALAVQGGVFLAPLVVWGLWRLRHRRVVRLGLLAWLLTLAAMTLVFPFAGARGGFFHSGAAVQPLLWAVVPAGLEGFVGWGVQRRGWHFGRARRVFGAGLVALAVFLSGVLFVTRTLRWSEGVSYRAVEQALVAQGAAAGEIVMVNNPPGYFYAAGRPAIVIPHGGLPAVLAAAERYGARYLVLEAAQGLDELYENPESQSGLRYLGTVEGARLFELGAYDE